MNKLEDIPHVTESGAMRTVFDQPKAASERAMLDPTGPAKVVAAVSTGWGPMSSAKALADEWNERAVNLNNWANMAYERGDWRQCHEYRLKAQSLDDCASELRRQMERELVRQPAPNVEMTDGYRRQPGHDSTNSERR